MTVTTADQTRHLKSYSKFALYRELSKSGIVTLVLISVLGGYLVGHPLERAFEPLRLTLTLIGILLLASGSSALNQIQERDIDATMPRTARRPIPSGRISLAHAWTFVLVGLIAGMGVLAWLDLQLAVLGVAAVISYNGLYTLWWKRRWAFAAVPGALPGALPILMGYAAADGRVFTPAGIYLFALLFFWQMPHFWSLAIRFRDDYAKGGFPTLPVALGTAITVEHIVHWCLAYIGIALLAPLFLPVSLIYCVIAFPMSVKLLWELRAFTRAPETKGWLRFFLWVNFSLILYIAAAVADLWNAKLFPGWQ